MGAIYIDGPLYKYVINFMNELLESDAEAITNLIDYRVDCNEKLAGHTSVQVGAPVNKDIDKHIVGILGILNGLCGTRDSDKYGFITAEVKDGKVVKFHVTRRQGDAINSSEYSEFEIKEVVRPY